ncbi:predicted protein [Plenodomus lingam JN3]|uniref:Uncharacterized protein n=1 Tax=Leptosphaeria maculans (strain JN3 / isolate v23.1.3 / race Av1-4-5-6-7-8) TaxID=985895 RepID=E5A758_LEPMJ|nr:predicted protein [Plenodomus lingam JN3]CBX99453.1 predicted protein [Plenodomus lingam JN3]
MGMGMGMLFFFFLPCTGGFMGKETAGLGLDGGLGLPVPSSDESQSLGGGGIDGGDGGDGGMERGTGLLGGARNMADGTLMFNFP